MARWVWVVVCPCQHGWWCALASNNCRHPCRPSPPSVHGLPHLPSMPPSGVSSVSGGETSSYEYDESPSGTDTATDPNSLPLPPLVRLEIRERGVSSASGFSFTSWRGRRHQHLKVRALSSSPLVGLDSFGLSPGQFMPEDTKPLCEDGVLACSPCRFRGSLHRRRREEKRREERQREERRTRREGA